MKIRKRTNTNNHLKNKDNDTERKTKKNIQRQIREEYTFVDTNKYKERGLLI